MTEHKDEQRHFAQQLQDAYQQDKAAHAMPARVKQQILQQAERSKGLPYHGWFRNAQLALGSVFLAVLGYLMLQPVSIGSYQIVVSYTENATKMEAHSLTVRSLPAVVAQFAADESQQRYNKCYLHKITLTSFMPSRVYCKRCSSIGKLRCVMNR
ncbi:hypothetical protein [Alishewanella longhuensis]